MTTPCIITAAITGSVPRKADNPAVPISVGEQIEATQAAYEAGATIAHMHARDEDETPSYDPERFAAYQEGVRKHCPGMIVQFSTGGRGRAYAERSSMLHLRPDMASLTTGSVNFGHSIYENSPAFIDELAQRMADEGIKPEIEVFDLSMFYKAVAMAESGALSAPVHIQFVLGVKNAQPARREILEFEVAQMQRLLPTATWTAAGIGKHQLEVNRWCLAMGGHCRTGLEDNLRYDRDHLAESNAQLVRRLADLCAEYDRHPASASEARHALSLPEAA